MVALEFQAAEIQAALGKALKARREELGLTQEQLFLKCGMAQKSISRYECGRGNLTYFNLKRMAAALDTPASKLLAKAERIERAEARRRARA